MGKRVVYSVSSYMNVTFNHEVEKIPVEELSEIWDELSPEEQEELIYDHHLIQEIVNNAVEVTAEIVEED